MFYHLHTPTESSFAVPYIICSYNEGWIVVQFFEVNTWKRTPVQNLDEDSLFVKLNGTLEGNWTSFPVLAGFNGWLFLYRAQTNLNLNLQ